MFPRWVWDYVRATAGEGGYAELRGWRYDVVGPRYCARPTVSEVASPCPTRRDVWLRRVAGVRVDSELLELGRAVHEVFLLPFRMQGRSLEEVVRAFKRLVRGYRGLQRWRQELEQVFEEALSLALASRGDGVPVAVEPRIPGGPVGLSDFVRPDALVGFVPVDVVLAWGQRWLERKEVALAAYAMAVEAWTGHPVDYAVAVGVHLNGSVRLSWKVVRVDDPLRRRFLELRDEVARIIEYGEDPGLPSACPDWCPFRGVCCGEGGVRGRAGLQDRG